MMNNKYTHHLSVAFVVSLEEFPIIDHKNPSPKFVFQTEQGEGCFTGYLYVSRRMRQFILSNQNSKTLSTCRTRQLSPSTSLY